MNDDETYIFHKQTVTFEISSNNAHALASILDY